MSTTDCLQRIVELGFAGVSVWEGTRKGKWCGCLLGNDPYCIPLHETNLFEYVDTVEEVFTVLIGTAEVYKEQYSGIRR